MNAKATGFPGVDNLQGKLHGTNKANGVHQLLLPLDSRGPLKFQGVPVHGAAGFSIVADEEFRWSMARGRGRLEPPRVSD